MYDRTISFYKQVVENIWCELGVFNPDKRRCRLREYTQIRQIIAYCLVTQCDLSYRLVGQIMGYDRTTILSSVLKIENELVIYNDVKRIHKIISKLIDEYNCYENLGIS